MLFKIVGAIGSPISLDEATHNQMFGHFARILIHLTSLYWELTKGDTS